MAIDLIDLGKRLAAARVNAGASQAHAAEAIGIPRAALSLIESGARTISTLELAGLAQLYRRPIAHFFDTASETTSDLSTHCRVAPEFVDRPELCRIVDELLEVCREGAGLQRLLSRNSRTGPPTYTLPSPLGYAEAVEQGLAVAADERRRLDIGEMPIADIAELLGGQGIWTSSESLPDGVSGLFLRQPDVGLAILINRNHPNGRRRLSYAHEYAHALMDRTAPITVTTRQSANDLVERRANAFAGAFLMPEAGVRALLESVRAGQPSRRVYTTYDVATDEGQVAERRTAGGATSITYSHAVLIAHHFEVTYQAACYRLKELGRLNSVWLEALLKQEETRARPFMALLPKGDALCGHDLGGRELQGQVLPLLLEALETDEITEGKARDIAQKLGMSRADTETLLAISK